MYCMLQCPGHKQRRTKDRVYFIRWVENNILGEQQFKWKALRIVKLEKSLRNSKRKNKLGFGGCSSKTYTQDMQPHIHTLTRARTHIHTNACTHAHLNARANIQKQTLRRKKQTYIHTSLAFSYTLSQKHRKLTLKHTDIHKHTHEQLHVRILIYVFALFAFFSPIQKRAKAHVHVNIKEH